MRSRAAVAGEVKKGINDCAFCGVAVGKVEVVDLKWVRVVVSGSSVTAGFQPNDLGIPRGGIR